MKYQQEIREGDRVFISDSDRSIDSRVGLIIASDGDHFLVEVRGLDTGLEPRRRLPRSSLLRNRELILQRHVAKDHRGLRCSWKFLKDILDEETKRRECYW